MNIRRFDSAHRASGLALVSEAAQHVSLAGILAAHLPANACHEVFAASCADYPSGWAFTLLLASLLAPSRSLFLVRAARRGQGRLYPAGLAQLGLDPDRCFQLHAPDTLAALRATADIARSGATGAVLVEVEGNPRLLDLTASRRLALAAEKAGTAVLLLRVDAREAPSAAYSRWQVASAPSTPLLADAPGEPAFETTLLRHRRFMAGGSARLVWNRGTGKFDEQAATPQKEDGLQRENGKAAFGAALSLVARRTVDPHPRRAA